MFEEKRWSESEGFYTFAHSKCPKACLGKPRLCDLKVGIFDLHKVTVTLQPINLLLYPRIRRRRIQGYIIGGLKVQRFKTNRLGIPMGKQMTDESKP